MNRVDALLLKMRPSEEGAGLRLTTAFITKDKGRWTLKANLWDGTDANRGGKNQQLISEHDTPEDAEAELETIRKKYGTHKGAASVTIWENDLED